MVAMAMATRRRLRREPRSGSARAASERDLATRRGRGLREGRQARSEARRLVREVNIQGFGLGQIIAVVVLVLAIVFYVIDEIGPYLAGFVVALAVARLT
jgi:hypothetical protein